MKPKALAQILLLSAVWGVSFLMMRIAVVEFPPLWIAMLRCALGAALLWTVLLVGGYRLPPRRLGPWLLMVALLNNAMPFTFFAWGERTVPSNIAAVLNATVPIWTLLFSMLLTRARVGLSTIVGVILAFAGVLIVVVGQGGEAAFLKLGGAMRSGGMQAGAMPVGTMVGGLVIIALAAVSYAVATLAAKARFQGLDPIGLATTQLSLATLMLLPLAVAGEHPAAMRPGPIAAVAVLGFAGSGIAYLLYYRLLQEISATQLAGVTYLMPIWGLFWGLFANESIGVAACIGVAFTIAGLVLVNMRPATPQPAPPPVPAPRMPL
jgi:drug/metabolite transporter (DMT)-like permease